MNIPQKFEYMDTLHHFKNRPEIAKFVTILDVFAHHYTGVNMYHVRIEYIYYKSNVPAVEYETLSEDRIVDMLATAIK